MIFLLVLLLLCLPASAQPEAALKLWQSLQTTDASQSAALIQADPEAARLLYQELYFESADCKLYQNEPFSPRVNTVRAWLAPLCAESAVLEPILGAEKCDFSGQTSGLGELLRLYQQSVDKPESKPAALAEAEKLHCELAVAALSLELDAAGAARAEATWQRWQHPLGMLLCDVLRGQAAQAKEHLDEAIVFYQKAAATAVKVKKWRVLCLERVATLQSKLGKPTEAAATLQFAIEAQPVADMKGLKRRAELETVRGGTLAQAGQHTLASQDYARAEADRNQAYSLERAELEEGLERAKKSSSPEAVYVASDLYLYLLDSVASERHDWETRGKVAQRRLELARERQDGSATAEALEALARSYLKTRPLKAKALALEAMELRQQKLSGKELQKSFVLLADIAYQQCDWPECLKLYERVIELSVPGATPPLFDLESASKEMVPIYQKTMRTARQGQVQQAFYARLAMGHIHHILGNFRAASQEYDRVEKDLGLIVLAGLLDEPEQLKRYAARQPTPSWNQLYEELKDGPDQERLDMGRMIAGGMEAVLTTQRALLLSDQGDIDGASRAYQLGIERTTKVLGGGFPQVGAYSALAGLEMDRGHYEAAEGPLQTALDQYVRSHNPSGTAGALAQLSALRRRQGKPLEAVALARQGVELADTLTDPVYQANLKRALGLAESELGGSALNDSEKHLRQAAEVYRGLGLRSALAFTLSGLGQTLERLRRDQEALAAYQEAVSLVELLATELSSTDTTLFNATRANGELYDRLIRLLLKLGQPQESFRYLERFKSKALMDALTGLQVHSDNPKVQGLLRDVQQGAEQVRQAERELGQGTGSLATARQVQQRYQQALQRLYQADPACAGLVSVGQTDLSRLQQRLPTGTLLLEYYPTAEQLYIFTVSAQQGPQVFSAPIGRQQLLQKVTELRAAIKDRQDVAALSQELYGYLLAPVQAPLQQAKSLVIVPGGELYYLPFHALMNPAGHYLVESKPISYLAQADLLPVSAPRSATGPVRLLALGNPDKSLPAASREVQQIGRLFPSSEVFVESRATLAQLARPRQVPAYLHLATHGTFNGMDPKESSLVLAGHPAQLSVRDLLEGHVKLRLQGNRLVTLSACQTNMGGNDPSALFGSLSRAFSRIGAPAVVASLWSVEDESTRQLMLIFYQGLAQGKPRAEALAAAQRQLLAKPEFSQPFFWAPFVLLGEWR